MKNRNASYINHIFHSVQIVQPIEAVTETSVMMVHAEVAVVVSIAINVKEALVIIVMITGKYGSTWNKIPPKTWFFRLGIENKN